MKHINSKASKQGGFVSLELILAIVAIALIMLAGIVAYGVIMSKIRAGNTVTLVSEIQTGVSELYASSHDFSDLDTATLISAGIVSKSDMDGSNIVTPWYSSDKSSIITVGPGENPSAFAITIASIPSDACSKIGTDFLNQDNVSVTANGTAVTTPADLAKGCASSNPATLVIGS